MIWMDVELEYLVKAWEQERRSLRNTEPVGAETVRGRKDVGARETCRRRPGARTRGNSGSRVDGREPTWNKQGSLLENHSKQWENSCLQLTLDVEVCGASRRTATASPTLEQTFCFTFDKVGVLEYSSNVTQKIDL